MPLLRLQQPCPAPAAGPGPLYRGLPARDRPSRGARARTHRLLDLLRRRHALADGGRHRRRHPGCDRRALGRRSPLRGLARGQSDQRRGRPLPRFPGGRGEPRLARRAGAERQGFALPRPAARCETGAPRDPAGARDLSAPFLRPDLRPAGPDAGGVGKRARRGDLARGRPSVALPVDHRGRHALPPPARGGQVRHARRRPLGRPLPADAGGDSRARPAGLRDFQPRPAGGGKPAQPRLLALRRICRRRAGRAWPLRRGRPAHRHVHREGAGGLGVWSRKRAMASSAARC